MSPGTELKPVKSGDLFDPTFRTPRSRQEDFQDPGAVVSREWLQGTRQYTREARNAWSTLWGAVAHTSGEWAYTDHPLAPVVASLDAAIAWCKNGDPGCPFWLRRDKVLELVRSLLRQVAAAGPSPG